ncbi:MAG: hypothetical protein AAF098_03255 [Pseudomonadota bacterium]
MKLKNLKWVFALMSLLLAAVLTYGLGQPEQDSNQYASPSELLDEQPGFIGSDDESLPSLIDVPDRSDEASSKEPVAIEDADSISLSLYSDSGYHDAEGRYVIDLFEQDYAYMTVLVADNDGRPIMGAKPSFEMLGTSELLAPGEISTRAVSDESGTLDFALIAGDKALDRVIVQVGDTKKEIVLNVISLEAAGFPELPNIEGALTWQELMQARINYTEEGVAVEFPPSLQGRAEQTVTLSGFMMPLEADLQQRRFLLTSNPPSCFFHIPGGPAGAVEVFAPEGIESSWQPISIEGRFELLNTDEYGVIYRLYDAELVDAS